LRAAVGESSEDELGKDAKAMVFLSDVWEDEDACGRTWGRPIPNAACARATVDDGLEDVDNLYGLSDLGKRDGLLLSSIISSTEVRREGERDVSAELSPSFRGGVGGSSLSTMKLEELAR
jgi:hypothetical protein